MKKILLLTAILFGIHCFSQSNILTEGHWRIQSLKIDGVTHPFVEVTGHPHYNLTLFQPSQFSTLLHNSFQGTIDSLTESALTISNFSGTLSQCPDSEFDLFENLYRNFFSASPQTFQYTITESPPYDHFLVITDTANGNQINYVSTILATEDQVNKKVSFYPNPVTDILKIENLTNLSLIKITDTSGKLVQQIITKGENKVDVQMKHLPEGTYFISINDDKPKKIIKK